MHQGTRVCPAKKQNGSIGAFGAGADKQNVLNGDEEWGQAWFKCLCCREKMKFYVLGGVQHKCQAEKTAFMLVVCNGSRNNPSRKHNDCLVDDDRLILFQDVLYGVGLPSISRQRFAFDLETKVCLQSRDKADLHVCKAGLLRTRYLTRPGN